MKRARPLVLWVVLGGPSVAGCGGEAAPVPSVRREVSLSGSSTAFSREGPPAPPMNVVGNVFTDHGHAVVGRAVVLVDRHGRRFDRATDDGGRFSVLGVTAPYDLAVGRTQGEWVVALGLSRGDPYVELPERLVTPTAVPRQTLHLQVRPKANLMGTVDVVTISSTGQGRSTFDLEPVASAKLDVDIVHAWREPDEPSDHETIDVHVFAAYGGEEATSFEYARLSGVRASPGGVSDLGEVELAPAPLTQPIAFGARITGVQHLQVRSSLAIDVEGALFTIAARSQPSAAARLPSIPGMLIRSEAVASHRRGDPAGVDRSAEAWSGNRAVESRLLDIADPSLGPELRRPRIDGTFGPLERGFVWRSSEAALFTLTVADTKRNAVRFRAHTMDDTVAFERLRRLGVPELLGGEHTLGLVTEPGVSVDALYSPETKVRWAHLDRTREGRRTSLHTPFRFASPAPNARHREH